MPNRSKEYPYLYLGLEIKQKNLKIIMNSSNNPKNQNQKNNLHLKTNPQKNPQTLPANPKHQTKKIKKKKIN